MNEFDSQRKSYQERLEQCPIHQWADIDDFLVRAEVPEQHWRPFHEILITRGEFPKYASQQQILQFAERAEEVIIEYDLDDYEIESMIFMLAQVIEQWLTDGAHLN